MKRTGHRREHGAAAFESVIAICILALTLVALLQIYRWCLTASFCEYAAYYTSKAIGLGYRPILAIRAARVAAIPVCGPNIGNDCGGRTANAEKYMTEGDGSGVMYRYWGASKEKDPVLHIWGNESGNTSYIRVTMTHFPPWMGVFHDNAEDRNNDPRATLQGRDYSRTYLEGN